VGQDDSCRRDHSERFQPVQATIDHDARRPARDEERAVATVAARSQLDLAACAKERELDVSFTPICELAAYEASVSCVGSLIIIKLMPAPAR
jgi:hypothetical protein